MSRISILGQPPGLGLLILLDEPTAALDLSHQIALFNTLAHLRDDEITVLVVLHDINLALRYAENVFLLASGHLVAFGAPLDVLNEVNLQEAFNMGIEIFATTDARRPFILASD